LGIWLCGVVGERVYGMVMGKGGKGGKGAMGIYYIV